MEHSGAKSDPALMRRVSAGWGKAPNGRERKQMLVIFAASAKFPRGYIAVAICIGFCK